MRAIRVHQFGAPEVLQEDTGITLPELSGDQLEIEACAIGVNPVDTYIRAGTYPVLPPLPYTPGNDVAGIVSAVGAGVTRYKVGDRVYSYRTVSGSYAEKVICHEWQCFPLPAGIDYEAGAALGVPYSTAFFALMHRGQARAKETLLIHGASGSVGMAAIQYGRQLGLTVIGTAGSEAGLALIKAQGVEGAVNHNAPGYTDEIMALTGGRGVDLILEMLANVNLAKDLQLLAHSGRVVVIGNRGSVEINPRDLMSRNAAVFGLMLMNAGRQEMDEIHALLSAGLVDGRFRPVISHRLPLKEAAKAHELVMQPAVGGKIILLPD